MAKAASSVMTSAIAVAVACILLLCAASAMAQTCTTDGNSPTQGDALTCVNYLRNLGNTQCCQTSSSGCTNMCTAGTAATDICGAQGRCTTCVDAGNNLNIILANCVRNINGARVAGELNGFRIRRS